MYKFFNNLFNKIGIDGAVFYTLLSRLIQGGSGIISIFFVLKFLSLSEQGFFYTFNSVIALQVFFELGLTAIITQFTAHEFANLKLENNKLSGNEINLSRLSSILQQSVKLFSLLALLLFVSLLVVGYIFFSKYNNSGDVEWFYPWIILVFGTALNLLMTPVLSFCEGIGKIKEVAFIRLIQYSIQYIFLFIFLYFKLGLFSSPIALICSFIIVPILLFKGDRKIILTNIWKKDGIHKVDYLKEIFPFQWKISLSWISGYFTYQLFNPLTFANEGAIIAGQMGMTLAVINGIQGLSLSWINTKIPIYSMFIANKKYLELNSIFKKTTIQSTLVSLFIVCSFVIFMYISNLLDYKYSERFLPLSLLILMAITLVVNQLIGGLAVYLRCHKKEPLLVYSFVTSILVALGLFLFGHFYGVKGIVSWYSFIMIFISLPWVVIVFAKSKKVWHTKIL